MASKTLHSSAVTFVDYSDNRQLDVYIASNLPTTQIYNPNTKTYSPDWSVENLQLNANVFLDSKNITSDSKTEIIWYQKNSTSETQIGEGGSYIVFTNELSNVSMITYVCKATYQGIEARAQITFTRSDTGLNGNDGTSVNIEGTAYYNGVLTDDNVGTSVPLYSDSELSTLIDTTVLANGDSYIVQGYLCIYNKTDNMFICSGRIQGPQGKDATNIILNADAQIFKIGTDNTMTPSTITVTAQEVNTTITQWSYSTNGGKTFLSTEPSGVVRNGNQVNITGENLESNMLVIKASDGLYSDTYTVYKVTDGLTGNAGQSAPVAFLTNESITFSADEQGRVTETEVTTSIVAYNGTEKVMPVMGSFIDVLPQGMTMIVEEEIMSAIPNNKEIILTIKISDVEDETGKKSKSNLGSSLSNSGTINIPITSPVSTVLTLSWSKINTGATGAHGADAITFQVYSAHGYVLSKETPFVMLQTLAYNGDTPIVANATYQWYKKLQAAQYELAVANKYDEHEDYYIKDSSDSYRKIQVGSAEEYASYFNSGTNIGTPLYIEVLWQAMTEEKIKEIVNESTGESSLETVTVLATSPYVTINHKGVSFSASYMCVMTFNDVEYIDVVTIDDKNDTNMVFTTKPQSYSAGDIWIVGNDYCPSGVEVGTVLKAQHTNSSYKDTDWISGTKYDSKLTSLETTVGKYQQFISLDTTYGITMNAVDEYGNTSEFSTTLSNAQLSFNQGDEAVAYINNHKMHITEAEIQSPLSVTGEYDNGKMLQAPVINLGSFSIMVESNGSLSFVSNL